MKLSVITPNFNHARFLPEMVGSILSQSYRDFEYIIIDDCSTDDSVAVIEALAATDSRIRFYRNEQNVGVVRTLNRGVSLATGDYVFLPAADDVVLPELLAKSMAFVEKYPQAGICTSLSLAISEDRRDLGVLPVSLHADEPVYLSAQDVAHELARRDSWMWGNTAFFRRDALLEIGCFRPELRAFADGFTHYLIGLRYGVCFIPEPLAAWRRMESGYSASTSYQSAKEMYATARQLLLSEYAGLVPADVLRRLEKSWSYALGSIRWASMIRNRPAGPVRSLLDVMTPLVRIGLLAIHGLLGDRLRAALVTRSYNRQWRRRR
ncbi:MAG: glycosyltransferase family 2 protein [Thermoanaerobaculia bacterium]